MDDTVFGDDDIMNRRIWTFSKHSCQINSIFYSTL